MELIDQAGPFVTIPALLALLLLLPLYFSQRRDIARLRDWMERVPAHPPADLRASEARLDRAEAELEELLGPDDEELEATAVRSGPPSPTLSAAAARVSGDRPALERITAERAALEPHPRWRRFSARITQPRALVAIALVALVLGAGAVVASERLLGGGTGGEAPRQSFDPSEVTVTVLNGTSVAGLAGKVQSDVTGIGYQVDTIGAAPASSERTLVMHLPGARSAARWVARDLGVDDDDLMRIDRPTRQLAGEAEVVVIAGEDRAR